MTTRSKCSVALFDGRRAIIPMPGIILLLLIAQAVAAEEGETNVPDPFGLGERLALIDYLRERQVPAIADMTLEQLRVTYVGLQAKVVDAETAADAAYQLQKFRARVMVDYGVDVPDSATYEQIDEIERAAKISRAHEAELNEKARVAHPQDPEPVEDAGVSSKRKSSPVSAPRRSKSDSGSRATPTAPSKPEVNAEPKFLAEGYILVKLSNPISLYLLMNPASSVTPISLWNSDDKPRRVEIEVSVDAKSRQRRSYTIGGHSRINDSVDFGPKHVGDRPDGDIISVKE